MNRPEFELTDALQDEIEPLLEAGREIDAVKRVRDALGCTLPEAKQLVDELGIAPCAAAADTDSGSADAPVQTPPREAPSFLTPLGMLVLALILGVYFAFR